MFSAKRSRQSSASKPELNRARSKNRSPQETNRSSIGTAPLCMLAITVIMSVLVLAQMIARDLTNDVGGCDELKIPKHHYCVHTRVSSFSEFLWQRSAHREHPLVVASKGFAADPTRRRAAEDSDSGVLPNATALSFQGPLER